MISQWVEGVITIKETPPPKFLQVEGWEHNDVTIHPLGHRWVISTFGFRFGSTATHQEAMEIGDLVGAALADVWPDAIALSRSFDNNSKDMREVQKALRPIFNEYKKKGVLE